MSSFATTSIPTIHTPAISADIANLFDELAGAGSKRGKIIEPNIVHMIESKPALMLARNAQGQTPLHHLVQHEEALWVEKWLALPAKLKAAMSVPAVSELLFARDGKYGQTPLQLAENERKMREQEGGQLADSAPMSRIIETLKQAEASALLALKNDIAVNEKNYYARCPGSSPFQKVLSLSGGPSARDLSSVESIRQVSVKVEGEEGNTASETYVNIRYFSDQSGKIHTTKGAFGLNPLHLATLLAKEELVKLFVEGGVDTAATCDFDLTPLEMAEIIASTHRHRLPQYAAIAAYLKSRQRSGMTAALGTYWRAPAARSAGRNV